MKTKFKGFSLIEIMIVMAILGIVAALAIPAYDDSLNRARRSDATIGLEKAAAMQEQHYFLANQYSESVNDLGGTGGSLSSPEGHYTISTSSTEVTEDFAVVATASSAAAQKDEDCYYFRLANTGARTAHKKADSSYSTHESDCLRD